MTFRHSIVLGVTTSLFVSTALTDIKIGFIGSLSLDTDLSILCGAEITIEEINAAGGVSGGKLVLASADTGEDVTEDVKAYGCPVGAEKVNFIISGFIDDVSLGWLPHMQEFQIPTLDTWTSYIGIAGMVIEGPETMAPYFMNIISSKTLTTLYINFGADMLKKEMGWDSVTVLTEDAVPGEAITGLVTKTLGLVVEIETKEIVTYDVGTVGFTPPFSRAQASRANFIYQVSSVDSQVISSQYVKLQVPMATADVDIPALGLEYQEDIGDADDDIFTLSFTPSVGFKLDPESQKFVDTYQAEYNSRPRIPHFNRFNAYWGLKQVVAAAEAAGGFGDAKTWFAEMKKQDITLKKDDKMQLRYAFWGDNEVEEVIGWTYPHNARPDLTAPYNDVQPSMVVIQWRGDGEVDAVYPPEYVTTKFTVPSQVK